MNYEAKHFSKCLFDPTKKDLQKSYPRLNKLFSINGVDETLIKYIICTYDYNSPFVREYKDLKLRKQSAAIFCGYDLQKDEITIDNIFNFKLSYVIDAIDIFLKDFMFSMLWYGIVSNEQTYWEYGKRLMQPIESGDAKEKDIISAIATKSKLSEDMAAIRQRIENDYKKLYGDDDLEISATKKKFKPEMFATKV